MNWVNSRMTTAPSTLSWLLLGPYYYVGRATWNGIWRGKTRASYSPQFPPVNNCRKIPVQPADSGSRRKRPLKRCECVTLQPTPLLTMPAQKGLCDGRASVRPSVCPVIRQHCGGFAAERPVNTDRQGRSAQHQRRRSQGRPQISVRGSMP